jgi:hypothetical protein
LQSCGALVIFGGLLPFPSSVFSSF